MFGGAESEMESLPNTKRKVCAILNERKKKEI